MAKLIVFLTFEVAKLIYFLTCHLQHLLLNALCLFMPCRVLQLDQLVESNVVVVANQAGARLCTRRHVRRL